MELTKVNIVCKNCGKEFTMDFAKPCDFSKTCIKCKSKMKIHFNGKTAEVVEYEEKEIPEPKQQNGKSSETKKTDAENTSMGKLSIVRFHGLLGRKTYNLHIGTNTIGRYDPELPCDIEIKNDSFMSRRSVSIEVRQTENGYTFKMNVLNASNPVYHNNKPLVVGEIPYLNYGDSIKLGNTTFYFDKV